MLEDILTDLDCPICGDKLYWYLGGTFSTCVAYFSPEGHDHDDNCNAREYYCKNHHKYFISKINMCPSCDWVGKEKCFCHPNKKSEKWFEEGEPILSYLVK